MSEYPKIQVTERDLWLLKCDHKLLPKWECDMWSKLSDVTEDRETVAEVYLLTDHHSYDGRVCTHKYQGYAMVDLNNYVQLTDKDLLL